MRDIHVGDEILGTDGNLHKVTFESIPESKPYYRITFNTNETIECCEDHLWTVYDNDTNESITLDAKQIYKDYQNNKTYYIPNTKPIDVKDSDINEDLYQFGYNLLEKDNIPTKYIFSSVNSRKKILQGLVNRYSKTDDGYYYVIEVNQTDKVYQSLLTLLYSFGFNVYIDDNTIKFKITDNQYRIITNIEPLNENKVGKCIQVDSEDHLYLCGINFLPTHNTTCTAAYCLWYAVFNEMKNVFILANKQSTSREILSRIQQQYEDLPDFLKPGVKEYNKLSIVFDNGSKIKCGATTISAIRGQSVNLLVIDEFAYIPEEIAQGFITSVFPTLSSSKESKLVLISTPNGRNTFFNLWEFSRLGKNDFVRIEGHWSEIHDNIWYKEQCRLLGDPVKIKQEIECVSEETLIDVFDKVENKYKKISISQLYNQLE